jgi:hypothetical protein
MKWHSLTALGLLTVTLFASATARLTAADAPSIFDLKNISALWIAPPWDAKKRGPEERMQMLKELGLSKFAYNGGSAVDAEIEAAKKHGIEIAAKTVTGTHHSHGTCQRGRVVKNDAEAPGSK